MIGKLSGVIDSVGEHSLILDVGGVGYLVECSAKTLATIPAPNEEVSLIIEMYVREQEIKLFGFLREEERCWFRLLIAVQGVGNKVAMTLLGLFEAEELAHAILTKDKAAITRTPGIGDKVASRIVQELKDKIPASMESFAAVAPAPFHEAEKIAISALLNLGWSRQRVEAMVRKISNSEQEPSEIIRLALRELGK